MRKFFIYISLLLSHYLTNAQEYKFTPVVDIECSTVKSQGRTGTCWSFATASFIEAEVKRISGKNIALSEMYTVRNTYPKKAWNYLMRQGKAQFSEGGLAHDVINSIATHGLVPENVFTGLANNETKHNHSEMLAVLKGMLNVYIDNPAKKLSPRWKQAIDAVLDIYLGKNVSTFTYEGQKYTPKSFRDALGIKANNYLTITSFSHQPFYSHFILNIPDNFSNGSMYNVPLDEFEQTIINALEKGYTVALDTDVSEPTFSSKDGLAVVPIHDEKAAESLLSVRPEKEITQQYRQQEFENFTTTDDHLMHITGMFKDQNGTIYFKTKNSWGSSGNRVKFGGYVYISSSFIKLKAISVTIHKNALTKSLTKKLKL